MELAKCLINNDSRHIETCNVVTKLGLQLMARRKELHAINFLYSRLVELLRFRVLILFLSDLIFSEFLSDSQIRNCHDADLQL